MHPTVLFRLTSPPSQVGVMEEMDAFLTLVALAMQWAPASLAYRPVRVRENAFRERRSHDANMDYKEAPTAATASSSSTSSRGGSGSSSRGSGSGSHSDSSRNMRQPAQQSQDSSSSSSELPPPSLSQSSSSSSSSSSAWPVGGKCSVRARHLSNEAMRAVQAMVQDEEVRNNWCGGGEYCSLFTVRAQLNFTPIQAEIETSFWSKKKKWLCILRRTLPTMLILLANPL